jgi:hypothetical protein
MLRKVISHLSYSNVMATVAVFMAMGGGAYALSIPRNSVGAKQIKRNGVGASEIKTNGVGASEIKRGAVRSSEVKDSSLHAGDFKAGELPAGPQGLPGAAGTARAYGLVAPGGTLDPNVRKGITKITKGVDAGRYCIELAAGIDPSQVEPVAIANYDNDNTPIGGGADSNDLTIVQIASDALDCPAGRLEVVTGVQNFEFGALVGNIRTDQGFFVIVP